jgi:protein-L-isoaspartate O-methyltransferase
MDEDESVPAIADPIAWYDRHSEEAVSRYESAAPEKINDWFRGILPEQSGLILDVGAGSGRDAAWLASLGHEVIAVEPSEQIRVRARELHADATGITWMRSRNSQGITGLSLRSGGLSIENFTLQLFKMC